MNSSYESKNWSFGIGRAKRDLINRKVDIALTALRQNLENCKTFELFDPLLNLFNFG
jgi:hypothetical protein